MPNLVPREQLESAYQASLIGTYGSAPVAALLFSLMAIISNALAAPFPFFKGNSVDLALYVDGLTGFYSAFTIYRLREIRKIKGRGDKKSATAFMVGQSWNVSRHVVGSKNI